MKKIYLLLVVAVLSFTSCHTDIWNSINDLDSRVKALEELCREMNTNISSLQALIEVIQSGDYITNIVPITKGGEVIGYTIMFKNHEPITIYNGEDGITANTPIIGATQDTDGVYYWTVNGEWLLDDNGNKIRVTGRDGQNGQDGQDGNDGQPGQPGQPGNNGQNGQNGADGITPTLKIENGMWYVSYDNGSTWTMLGQATGDPGQPGQPGQNGQDGESIFANITYDANSVVFTLSDGTTITVPRGNGTGGTTPTVPIVDGAIMAPFSVSATKQVYFSQGVLLYTNQGTHSCYDGTTKPGTWTFAPSQLTNLDDVVNGIPICSDSASATYQGYIMHFQFGTSGFANTLPYSSTNPSTTPKPYYNGTVEISQSQYNWGVYNPISNGGNQPNQWRLLSIVEWDYIMFKRPYALSRRFSATVAGHKGVVLLPDNWNNTTLRYTIRVGDYVTNTYTAAMWHDFEKEGAVFLSLDLCYYSNQSLYTNNGKENKGIYWLSDVYIQSGTSAAAIKYSTDNAYSTVLNSYSHYGSGGLDEYGIMQDTYHVGIVQSTTSSYRLPVRLVKDVPASSNN